MKPMTTATTAQHAREAIAAARAEITEALDRATALVTEAEQADAAGELDRARRAASEAADILLARTGDCEAVAPLEELVWAGDPEGWERHLEDRSG